MAAPRTNDPMPRRPEPAQLLTIDEVAEDLPIPVATLYQRRHKGMGPNALKLGRHLRWFGHEAALIVRVDDCAEIYARLADAEDLLDSRSRESAPIDRHDHERLAEEDPRHIGDAVDALLERLQAPAPGIGFEL